MVIEGLCVTVAMYCLIQFYIQIKDDLAEHKPLLKVAAIKLVIFLSFWQTVSPPSPSPSPLFHPPANPPPKLLISFLTSAGAIKPSQKIQTPDIKIGIPSMLLCIEMAFFSIFHLWAFPWRVYDIRRSQIVAAESAPGFLPDPATAYSGGPFGIKALMDAFNPWDLIKAVGRGFKWFVVGRHRRMDDISYKNSAHGTGLEPTRNQHTAFENAGNNSLDAGPQPYLGGSGGGGGKPGRYHPITPTDDDADHLLTHAQTNPRDPSPYPRPMQRLPHLNAPTPAAADIGTANSYDPPPPPKPHPNLPYPTTTTTTIPDPRSSEDTSYHGAGAASLTSTTGHRRNLTPTTVPPDSRPLGPLGGSGAVSEWDMWSGGRESERDLGGGHGVGDNRF